MYAILGTIKVKPEHLDEFVENVREHARHSVQEPGCLRYDVLQDRDDPLTVVLYEVFRGEADLDAHRQHGYYQRWMEMSKDWRDTSSYSRRVLDHIHPPNSEWG
ncbi:MAG: putative quinol monooxygenase [Dehalococcoidia bacterium]